MEKRKKVLKNESDCVIEVQAIPRSSKSVIEPISENLYKVRLTSPPVDGLANEQLTELLARQLGAPRRNVQIISGLHARKKKIRIQGFDQKTVRTLLDAPRKK